MGVAQRLRDAVSDSLESINLVTGVDKDPFNRAVNYGMGDVRFKALRTQVITLNGFGTAADAFKIRVGVKNHYSSTHDDGGDFDFTDTASFVHTTNATAAAIQTALRAVTGFDASCTVAGTTNQGPFTVTSVAQRGQMMLQLKTLVSCSGNVTEGTLAYDDPVVSANPNPLGSGINFDQESSKGFQSSIPLGYSTDTDGTGQTRGTALAIPTVTSCIGGSGGFVTDITEVASGGTNAVVLMSIYNIGTKNWVTETQGVALEDADGVVTTTGMTAGDYAVFFRTQTAPGRVSKSAPPEFCTVT